MSVPRRVCRVCLKKNVIFDSRRNCPVCLKENLTCLNQEEYVKFCLKKNLFYLSQGEPVMFVSKPTFMCVSGRIYK